MLLILALSLFVGLSLAIYTIFEQVEERATVRASLRQLEDYEVATERERELMAPAMKRVAAPALAALVGIAHRLTPAGYVENTRHKLLVSGQAAAEDVDRFLAIRVLTITAIPVLAVLWYTVMPLHGKLRPMSLLMIVAVLALGPDAILNRRMQERQAKITRALPDVLDLLTISVEAGLGFEQALDRTVSSVPGPLSDEFIRMLNETRAGSSRAEAMRGVERRTDVPEVRSFVLAILQADTFGVSIGRILRAQADEMRVKRRQTAQERAMKAPVKMLLPMVFCIFPALFVVVLGPAAINIVHAFSQH